MPCTQEVVGCTRGCSDRAKKEGEAVLNFTGDGMQ